MILDGTFLDPQKRKKIFGLLRGVIGNNFVVINVHSSEETIIERIKRGRKKGDFSEGDYDVYLKFEEKLKSGDASYPSESEGIKVIKFENDLEKVKRDFVQIKAIIWDIDGTLYQDVPRLRQVIRKRVYQELAKALRIEVEEAEKKFTKKYQEVGGTTKTLIRLGVDGMAMIDKIFSQIEFSQYLQKDPKLTTLFQSLRSWRHLILTNNSRVHALRKLKALGIDPVIFEKMIACYDLGFFKPEREAFKAVFKRTGLPADQHLSVGDKEITDILPAKKLGMKTMMVWGKSDIADVSLPEVYDIVEILR